MRVWTTPDARAAMDDEAREYIAQEDIGDDGSTLSLLRSSRGHFIAKLYHPDLGEVRTTSMTLAGAIRKAIVELHAVSPVDLKDYVDVKERIRLFYEKYPDGRLVTTEVRATSEPDGVPRVWAEASAYRTPDDPHPGVGWSWLILPGSTNFTRGSEIENAETSAWGRAIGSLGIGISGSIASKDEIDAKVGEATRKPEVRGEPVLVPLGEQTFTGRVAKGDGDHNDLEFHADPKGYKFGFKLVIGDGQSIPQVICTGALGTALLASGVSLLGQTVTVTGEAFRVEQPGRRAYRRLMVETIEGDGFKIPAGPYAVEPTDKVDDLDQLPF